MLTDLIYELNAAGATVAASVKDLDLKREAQKGTLADLEAAKADRQAALEKHDVKAVALASATEAVAEHIISEAKSEVVKAEAALKNVVTSAVEVSNRLQGELVVAARAKAEALLSDLFADKHQNMVKHHAGMTKIVTDSASLPSLFLNDRQADLIEGVARNFAITSASLIEFAAKVS
ncbi:MAG: hypothetical protein JO232_10305 [Verrucomicrobia bacterium]|nr:hypothetical protein [Verrucomicrobiota bacterium]